jgi:hypothetical protein
MEHQLDPNIIPAEAEWSLLDQPVGRIVLRSYQDSRVRHDSARY